MSMAPRMTKTPARMPMLIPAMVAVERPEPVDCCMSEDARSFGGGVVGEGGEVLSSLSLPPLPLPPPSPDFWGRVVVVVVVDLRVVVPAAGVETEDGLGGMMGGIPVVVVIAGIVVVVGGTDAPVVVG